MLRLHLGTIGWSYNFWKGSFYPNKTSSKSFLSYYSSQFRTVEVDSTFYRIPTEQAVINWNAETSDGFLFSLKFPQVITHIKALRECQRETDIFLSRAKLLGKKLGVLLLQFPPNFSVDHFDDLEKYLQQLPKVNRYVVEVRNKGWLSDEFYRLLRVYNVAFAWAENPRMPTINEITAGFLYIRWEGNRKAVNGTLGKIETDKKADLEVWAKRIKPYLTKGMDVFGYFGKYYSGLPPSDVKQLNEYLA